MRKHTFLLGVLLLVDSVFGVDEVKSVSVMKGDSVTLITGLTDIQNDDGILWKFEGSSIARINKEAKIFSTFDVNGRFRDSLTLDKKTGSLTITNIRPELHGLYQLDISGESETVKKFIVTVHDVETVSVMEGDTVTLHTNVTKIQKDDVIRWFGDQGALIADLNSSVDSRWRNINLNNETGDLTILNIRDQSEDYKVEIVRSSMILYRKFHITFSGVFSVETDGVKSLSVLEGDPVILHTRITNIPEDDVIEWTFGPQKSSVVKTDRVNKILLYNEDEFPGKLHLDITTGDLTISNINPEVSGLYQLKIIKSAYTIEKSFSVTVGETRVSGAASRICGAGIGVVVWAVTFFLLQEV